MNLENANGAIASFTRLLEAIPKGKYARVMQDAVNVELVVRWARAAHGLLERHAAQAKLTEGCPAALVRDTENALAPME